MAVLLPLAAWASTAATCHRPPAPPCPHTFVDSAGVAREIALVGALTNVPEFHDCQAFIERPNGRPARYSGHYAVYIRHLGASAFGLLTDTVPLRPRPGVLNQPQVSDSPHLALPGSRTGTTMAIIYSYGGTYAALGIQPYFNCVYLKREDRILTARVVPVGTRDDQCAVPLSPGSTAGTLLRVTETNPYGLHDAAAYPSAARWHWDEESQLQFIGMGCGTAYCLIGPENFVPTAEPLGETVANMPAEFKVAGWGDEQRLAYLSGGRLVPGPGNARIFPHSLLATYDMSDFRMAVADQTGVLRRQWLIAAYLQSDGAIPGYDTKLNLNAGPIPHGMSTVELCHGTHDECAVKVRWPNSSTILWWMRITSPDGKSIYKRVTHRAYPHGLPVPGLVRWRWKSDDEMTWIRCPEGCCESIE